MEEHDMAGRVAGAMDHVERQLTNRHCIALLQPAGRLEALGLHPVARTVIVELLDPEKVVLVRPLDRQAKLIRQHPSLPAMIEMTMGDEDLLQRHTRLGNAVLEFIEIAARIGQRSLHRLGAPDQRAILLKRCYRNDGSLHGRSGFVGHCS